jgi:hypothetical protein
MKLDYKKLWQQQKKQNILLRTENERLEKKFIKVEFERNEFKALFEDEIKNANSWEQLYNKQQGKSTGILECFNILINNQKK